MFGLRSLSLSGWVRLRLSINDCNEFQSFRTLVVP